MSDDIDAVLFCDFGMGFWGVMLDHNRYAHS
jgi:hypothetical protein